ncbi:MAG: methyltransferase family protein [Nitrospinales bacterium]
MAEWAADPFILSYWLVYGNFVFFLAAFLAALYLNLNFNTVLVGLIYLIPMTPLGLNPENAVRVHLVSFENLIYGLIELAVFVITVRKTDLTFDREHIRQLLGHTLPIAAALMGLSFVSRMTMTPVTGLELVLIGGVFLAGAGMRILAIRQLGGTGFKFDIVFRDEQKLKTDQLYGYMRHPSYTAMMLVILAYALTTHNAWAGGAGMLAAWFGFQFRVNYEEKALAERFGKEYSRYRAATGMWFPKWKRGRNGGTENGS